MADDDAENDGTYNLEIIALLQQVGQRLISHEQDRKALKFVMDDLLEKAEQNERAFLTIQDRINKSESIIEKRQKALEKIHKEQMAKVEKAVAMSEKIEEALAQHGRMNRRLDKVVQDKARMIRKLDRIEEAVLETQDSINSKALALLAEHEASKGSLPRAAQDEFGEGNRLWWQQHGPVRAGAVVAMVLLGVFGGWAISTIQGGSYGARIQQVYQDSTGSRQIAAYDPYEQADPPSFDELNDYDEEVWPAQQVAASEDEERFVKAVEGVLNEEELAPAEKTISDEPVVKKSEKPAKEDGAGEPAPLHMDDEKLLASLDENPDALAAQLNEISPAAAADIIDGIHDGTSKKDSSAQKVAFTPGADIKDMTTAVFLKAQTDSRPLKERIKADSSLPPVIKEVEKKAFEGVPEAQHDIAAIYTAGHGGVETDYTRAALWFKESALQGITNARYNLGVLYHQGLGVEQDINLAVRWYQAAAEGGHPEAQYNLGIAYIEGIGTRYNPDKAAYYFEESAKQGILEAAYNLGLIYENGLTGSAQPDEALYWYKQAADMGSPEAKIAMDQLAKTLGLFPDEIERLYGKRKGDKAEVQPAKAPQNKAVAVSSSPKPEKQASGGVEYIEAQPLDAYNIDEGWDTEPALAGIKENTNPVPEYNQAVVAQLQEQLIRVGLYPGPADGVYDSLTEDAIRAYQTHYSLAQDGRPSQALLVHMMTSELGSSHEYGSRAE